MPVGMLADAIVVGKPRTRLRRPLPHGVIPFLLIETFLCVFAANRHG
jgi:hypothetical protein